MNIFIVSLIMVSIFSMIIPFSSINAQTIIPNELQQQYPQPYGMSTQDYMYMMQMMQFYMNMFGPQWQDQVIKIYEDDDDDDDDDHDHDNDKKKDRGDWKKWFKKHYDGKKDGDWKDKKKYCEGKGTWNGHKCVTNNEKDRADWEDAVCDNKPGSNSKICGKDDNKDENEDKEQEEQEQPEFSFISDENENNEVEEQEGSEESEPEEKEEQEDSPEESKDDDSSDDDDDDDGGDSDDGGGDSDDGGGGGEN